MHALVPYVKLLVLLYPQIKENLKGKLSLTQIRNCVYRYETQSYVAQIHNKPLDFNPGVLGFREFDW